MNRKVISSIWTAVSCGLLILFFLLVSINLKTEKEKYITLGLQTVSEETEGGIVSQVGGTEDIYSATGDVPIPSRRVERRLSPLEKPPYRGGGVESGKKKGYELSGELSRRKLIKFQKPEYPEKENENTVVKLRISANPDGTIKSVEVIKTGGLAFDRASIEAVQQWRFQALPPEVEKTVQTGIVTVYFELK